MTLLVVSLHEGLFGDEIVRDVGVPLSEGRCGGIYTLVAGV